MRFHCMPRRYGIHIARRAGMFIHLCEDASGQVPNDLRADDHQTDDHQTDDLWTVNVLFSGSIGVPPVRRGTTPIRTRAKPMFLIPSGKTK